MANPRQYSRLARVEENRSRRSILVYTLLTIFFILFLGIFGLKILSAFTKVVTNVNTDENTDISTDTTPPPPPRLTSVPISTNQTAVSVSGSAEPGSSVSIYYNDQSKVASVEDNGQFSTTLDNNKSDLTIYAMARDNAGNESGKSTSYTVTYDDQPPKVENIAPQDGTSLSGSKQKQITVEGTTESEARVTINDHVVIVDSTGKFKYPTNLGNGDNSFNIKSTDKAGNQTELTIHINYSE